MSRLSIGLDIASNAKSVLYGSTASLVAGGLIPEFAADFLNEYFRNESGNKDFDELITHTRNGNATMTGDYGPELVTNGDFSNGDTGWTVSGSDSTHYVTFENGTARYVSDTTSPTLNLSQTILEVGKTYEFVIKILDYVSGGLKTDSFGSTMAVPTSVGVHRFTGTASSTTLVVQRSTTGVDITIDNISVREIPKIQWAPHNLLTYSEDFSNAAWVKGNSSVSSTPPPSYLSDAFTVTRTAAGGYLRPNSSYSVSAGQTYTLGVFAKNKSGTLDWGFYDVTNTTQYDYTFPETTSEWAYYSQTFTVPSGCSSIYVYLTKNMVDGSSVDVSGAHLYRSDLGGMVDNPADERVIPSATKYVRTAGREVTGTELVTNGTFDTDTSGWYAENTTSISSVDGQLVVDDSTSVGTDSRACQNITTEVGKVYKLSFDKISTTSTFWFSIGTTSVFDSIYYSGSLGTTTGQHEHFFVATDTTTKISMITSSSGVTVYDNVSVKEIDVDPSAARYLPRRGHHVYNGSQWVNKGLLHESEARTNLVTQSDDMADAIWLVQGGSWGTADANGWQEFTGDGATSERRNYDDTANLTDGSYYTLSVDMEYVDYRWGFLAVYDGVTTYRCWFDLQNGVKGITGGSVAGHTMAAIGPNQYRCSVTIVAGVSASGGNIQIGLASGDGGSGTFATSGKYKARHPQFEQASTPSSYIPTSGSSVTRPAETLTIPSANLPWPSPVYVTNEELFASPYSAASDWTVNGDGSFTRDGTQTPTTSVTCVDRFEANKIYHIQADVSGVTAGQWWVYFGGVGFATGGQVGTQGFHEFFYMPTSAGTGDIILSGDDLFDGTVTLSVKEINPLALSIQMSGEMVYPNNGEAISVRFFGRSADASNSVFAYMRSDLAEGTLQFRQYEGGVSDLVTSASGYQYGINVPFDIASRHGSTFINGAVDGTALTGKGWPYGDTTPVALPDLSSTDLELGYYFMGTIDTFRIWASDIGDTGIAEATEPSEEATLFLSFDGTENSYVNFDWSQ